MDSKRKTDKGFIEHVKLFYRALGFAFPFKKYVYAILTITFILSAIYVLEPVVLGKIIDSLESDDVKKNLLTGIVYLVLLSVARETGAYFNNRLTWKTKIKLHESLLSATIGRIYNFPIHIHRKEGVGAIMNRLEKGINGFVSAVSEISFNFLPSLVYLAMALVVMFQLNWKMTLLVLIYTPLPPLFAYFAAPIQKKREKYLLDSWSRIYARLNEVLSGILTVRSFAMENSEKKRFLSKVKSTNSKVLKGVKFDSGVGAIQTFTATFAKISAIVFGSLLIMNNEMSIGTLVAFLGFIGGLFGPIQGLTGAYKTLQTASVNLVHIFNILDMEDTLQDSPDSIEAPPFKGEVRFNNVHFAYSSGRPEVLKNINLYVKPGETIAIVGPSGSGKSTLMALMQRFFSPSSGSIEIDGHDLRNCQNKSVRKQIGVVLQDIVLFNESIHNNILYGKPEASREEVINAAKAANIHEKIMQFEKGYSSMAGERGNNLSLGERQRVAIARALLKNAPILILDEATSSLDTELEAKVQEALDLLVKDRTTFIIAHRLATVVNADRIIVLKEGSIVESGTHFELMNKKGHYCSLVSKQIGGLVLSEENKHLRSA
jgi:ATP-binding cassette, subfamily B, bacterial